MFIGQEIPSEGVAPRPKAIMSVSPVMDTEGESRPVALLIVSVMDPIVNEIPEAVPAAEPVPLKEVSTELHDIDILPAKQTPTEKTAAPDVITTTVTEIKTDEEPKPFPWWVLAVGAAGAMYALS